MSTIQRAYKSELALNNAQITACKKHAGAARWAYNWGLQRKQREHRKFGKSPSAIDLHRELNTLKPVEVPWTYEVSKCAPQAALRNLDTAFAHYFRRMKLKQAGKHRGKLGDPRFKTKKRGSGSFRLTVAIAVFPNAIQLPRLGRLRLKEHSYLPTSSTAGVKILPATVSAQAGHWYVSVLVERELSVPENTGPVVGVDLGVKVLATRSAGTVILNPRPLKRRVQRLQRFHRAVSRTVKGSKSRRKATTHLARRSRKVRTQPHNTLQQLTCQLARTQSVVVLEDLHVSGLLKNHHVAQAIGDVGFFEVRRQLVYTAAWFGSRVVLADRWEPSSKTCSGCGWVDEPLELADRTFHCGNPRVACGLVLDRDLNAALNVVKLAGSSSDNANACGEGGAGRSHAAPVQLPSVKQEPNTGYAEA
ncbi:MAG TPA: RNA-guided endonuclease TnpB family protein [Ktedonobacterales bacterium]|jgi:putative transposase|nr:RNA-guided endonuclease TnpB family protein [Ktedonobacterales bacterium]